MKNTNAYNRFITLLGLAASFVILAFLLGCSKVQTQPLFPTAATATVTQTPQSQLPFTPTPYIARLIVDPDTLLQTIQDTGGGNFIHRYGGTNSALDPISRMNIAMLSPSIARVSIDLDIWEPQNDDTDPLSFNPEGFLDAPGTIVRDTFEFMREFQEMGENQVLIGSVWYVPDFMVSNPDADKARSIPEEMLPEVIESLAAWLLHARNEYGVEVPYISFNEANLGINVLLNSDDYIPLIQLAGQRFQELGLSTQWLLSDASNMSGTTSYARAIYSEPAIHSYLGPLAFHSWDMTASDDSLVKIADFARENGLETWCTEGGWNASLWQHPEDFPTFRNALNQAIIYARVLKLTGATRLLYWEMMGKDYSMNDGSQPYPILSFMVELKRHFPPGAQIVSTGKDAQSVKYVAAKTEDTFSVLIVNRNPEKENAVIEGLPAGSYTLIRSDKDGMNKPVTSFEVNDQAIEFEIAPSSINFLTTHP
jgi:hypothetical protein